jgi:hypothetical protein
VSHSRPSIWAGKVISGKKPEPNLEQSIFTESRQAMVLREIIKNLLGEKHGSIILLS